MHRKLDPIDDLRVRRAGMPYSEEVSGRLSARVSHRP